MKYKVLLTGNNQTIINEFFTYMYINFDCMSTSERFEDIVNHLKYVEPDIFVYCLYKEKPDALKKFVNAGRMINESMVPIVIIGNPDDCDQFLKAAPLLKVSVLRRPISYQNIKASIINVLDEKKIKEEQLKKQKEAAKQKEKETERRKEIEKQKEVERQRESTKQPELDLNILGEEEDLEDISDLIQAAQKRLTEMELSVEEATKPKSRKKHILVVDDDSSVLKLIKGYLTDQYDVATAINGKVAMRFLETKETDLVLLDYEMPIENGPSVLSKIRANEKIKDLPVLFLTGVSSREKIKEVLAMKPQGYLLKPIDMHKLSSVIKKILG